MTAVDPSGQAIIYTTICHHMDDKPRCLADVQAIQQRLATLDQPHVSPLTEFVRGLRAEGYGDVPYFDPLDGGINATSLFLLEKPGPKAALSGFVSRDNNDKTAENIFNFMIQAKIDRTTTCLWNTIPGWNGTTRVTSAELNKGAECLHRLFGLLPKLRVVVLVGKKAQRMSRLIEDLNIAILASYHPSPKNYALARDKWADIPHQWAKIHAVAG